MSLPLLGGDCGAVPLEDAELDQMVMPSPMELVDEWRDLRRQRGTTFPRVHLAALGAFAERLRACTAQVTRRDSSPRFVLAGPRRQRYIAADSNALVPAAVMKSFQRLVDRQNAVVGMMRQLQKRALRSRVKAQEEAAEIERKFVEGLAAKERRISTLHSLQRKRAK